MTDPAVSEGAVLPGADWEVVVASIVARLLPDRSAVLVVLVLLPSCLYPGVVRAWR